MNIQEIVENAARQGASDIHIIAGLCPKCRIDGEIVSLMDTVLTPADTIMLAKEIAGKQFTEIEEIGELDKILCSMFDMAEEIFAKKDVKSLHFLHEQEEKTDKLKQDFYGNHYERVIKDECSPKMTPYISQLIVELERIADHLTNIGYSIINPTGDDE